MNHASESLCRTLEDTPSWTTCLSRSKNLTAQRLSLNSDSAIYESITDISGLIQAFQNIWLKQIPYDELREVGHVAEGSVFSVREHNWRDRVVAVKHIKHGSVVSGTNKYAFQRLVRSVLQEMLIMHHEPLASHPNIISLLGFGWQIKNGITVPYTVVEYGSIGSVRSFLAVQNPPWSLQYKTILAGDIVAGLSALHQNGIVHGDLKLDNVVLSPSQDRPCACIAKLCDFSKSMNTLVDKNMAYYQGTPLYLPPEALKQEYEPIPPLMLQKCDIWAYGLALWEILIDGECYFQESWRQTPTYLRSVSTDRLPSRSNYPTTHLSSEYTDPIPISHRYRPASQYFGEFDLRNLQKLSHQTLYKIYPDQTLEHAFLVPLLTTSLDPSPDKRENILGESPIMLHWRSIKSGHALQANSVAKTHFLDDAIDTICHKGQCCTTWEQQVHMFQRLQTLVEHESNDNHAAVTAFQLMACYTMGFGCPINLKKAYHYLEQAIRLGLDIAMLFGDALKDAFNSPSPPMMNKYEEVVMKGFSMQRHVSITPPLFLHNFENSTDLNWRLDSGSSRRIRSSSLLKAAMELPFKTKGLVFTTTSLYSSNRHLRFSWPEYAILTDDLKLLQICCRNMRLSELERPGFWNESLLVLACRKGRPDMLLELLSHGMDPAANSGGDCNVFHWLFCLGENAASILDVLKTCFLNPRSLQSKINEVCTAVYRIDPRWPIELTGTPLAFAVVSGNYTLVKRLLDNYADPLTFFEVLPSTNSDAASWTAIHLAVKYNFAEMVQVLCAHVAMKPWQWAELSDLRFPKFQLATALSFLTRLERYSIHGSSSQSRLLETIRVLPATAGDWTAPNGTTPLWQAIDYENTEVVEALLSVISRLAKNKIRNPKDPNSYTLPMHYAAYVCNSRGSRDAKRIPKLILSACGSALQLRDSNGGTVLHAAVSGNYTVVTDWLISHGCDVNIVDSMGRTPLMLCGSAANASMLLQNGAKVNILDVDGLNAAHHATSKGREPVLQILIDHGVSLHQVAKVYGTPLHFAIAGASTRCVEQLCSARASVNLANLDGDTSLHFAIKSNENQIIEILIRQGADLSLINDAGHRAVSVALRQLNQPGTDTPNTNLNLRVLDVLLSAISSCQREDQQRLLLIDGLHTCVEIENFEMVKHLLTHAASRQVAGVDLNSIWNGRSLIHTAAHLGRVEIAKALLGHGADPHVLDSNGADPLITLCLSDSRGIDKLAFCDILLPYRPDLTTSNKQGQSAWTIVLNQKNFSLMTRLLTSVPEPVLKPMIRTGPLTWRLLDRALRTGHKDFVEICLARSKHIDFLQKHSVLKDLARVLECPTSHNEVVWQLSALLGEHSDLVLDALHGKSIEQRMIARVLRPNTRKRSPFFSVSHHRGAADAVDEANAQPVDWISKPIREYLAKHEPEQT